MLSSEDTKSLNVPFALYVSPDEPADEVAKINEIMSKKPFADKNDSKLYETMFHGWAAARSNLEDEENKKQCVIAPVVEMFPIPILLCLSPKGE